MSGPKLSKWEQKQQAAKQAEAKFEANQRLAKHRAKHAKKGKGIDRELDAAADAFGAGLAKESSTGPLGWLVAHRKAVIGVAVVLLAGGVIFGMCRCIQYRLKVIPGQPRSELFLAGTLIVIDHVAVGGTDSDGNPQQSSGEGERLTAIDAGTGKEIAVNVSDYKECWEGGTRLVCATKYDQVELLDPRTLDVTHEAADLIAAAKLAKPSRRYQREGEQVVVVLEDGRGASIDPTTAKVTVLDTVETHFPRPVSSTCDTTHVFQHGATRWIFDHRSGATRRRLTTDPPPPSESATPSGPALTFLDGGFLVTSPPHPLAVHSATTEQRKQLLSRIAGISKEGWRLDLGGTCRRAWISGSQLIVATSNPAQRALAIDVESGAVVWRFGR